MPNTREMELWRLVNKAFQNSIDKFGDIFAKDVTRDLLANGVTVQEQLRDHYWATEQAYKNGYAKAVKDFAERLHIEIVDARNSNFKAKKERIKKYKSEDGFTMYCDGKIHALDGIDYFADNLAKEMVGVEPPKGE